MKSSNLSSFLAGFLDTTVDSWPKFDLLVVLNSESSLKGDLSGGIAAEKLAIDYLDCLRLIRFAGVLSTIVLMFLLIVGSMGGRVS